jgi:formylglycine-generating enzyme
LGTAMRASRQAPAQRRGPRARRWRLLGISVAALGLSTTMACELLIRDVSLGAGASDAGPDVTTGANDSGDAALGADAADADAGTGCARKLPDAGDRPGPLMVLVDASTPFCIDTTEVTNAQFNAYLVASGELIDPPEPCGDAGVGPPARVQDPALANQPARAMTACYAWSFCKWAGKRLCGLIGDGGLVPYGGVAKSEWGFACTNGRAQNVYPYGDTYDPTACNTEGSGPADAGAFPRCRGPGAPFSAIVDMVGNIGEYMYDFPPDGTGGATGGAWGGSWSTKGDGCAVENARNVIIFGGDDVGIRCCADL